MKLFARSFLSAVALLAATRQVCDAAFSRVIHETTSPYHHIRVLDDGQFRTLYFDDAPETRMSIAEPFAGQFEYTEYFHLAWLWNTQINNVLMVGLGGGSAQRAFERCYRAVTVETAEIDPAVLEVAKDYFNFKESPRQKVHISDGRVYVRRSSSRYDLVVLDAYVRGRYGSSIPQHLATKEFFQVVRQHLTTNGIVAYNVIGNIGGWHAEIVGSIYRTLNSVFPQVYVFPCKTSQNIVLIATVAANRASLAGLRQRAQELTGSGRVTFPAFQERLESLQIAAPPNTLRCPILTDDYAPVEGLSSGTASAAGRNGSKPGNSADASRAKAQESQFSAARARMVAEQLAAPGRGITNSRVLAAMGRVLRHEFVPQSVRQQAYLDYPLPIGHEQTISQPFIVAFMTEQLQLRSTDRVLEIGTGSGYQAAVLAELADQVYSIEIISELAQRAIADLARLGYTNVHVRAGDGYRGWPEVAPFDAIIVTCAPPKIPESLLTQLKEGGRMIVPTGTGSGQQLILLTKSAGKIQQQELLPVRFVPMTGGKTM